MFNSALLRKLSAVALLLGIVLACKSTNSSDNLTVLTSPDGKFQLSVPEGFAKASDLSDMAQIQAGNDRGSMWVMVLSDSQDSMIKRGDPTLDEYTALLRKDLLSKFESPQSAEPESLSINGYDARQYEIQGMKEHVDAYFLVTTVRTPTYSYQIVAWTLASKMSQNKNTLRTISASFREVRT
jgi:hypothetical protein